MDIFEQLRRDEGEVLHVYLDSKGIRTGGVGRNLEAHGIDWPVGTPISKDVSDGWLAEDVALVKQQITAHLPWASGLNDARQGVLENIAFNAGIHGLLGFKHMLAAAEAGDYALAGLHIVQSTIASARAHRLERQMESGIWV